jgi:PST family polysaccharide transporter
MPPADAAPQRIALWKGRWLSFGTSAATAATITIAGVLRTKWLALHLEPAGIGVLGQITAGQTWLGVAAGLGVAFPLTRAVGAARGAGDPDGQRRAVWSAIGLVGLATGAVVVPGLAAAEWLSIALLGTPDYAVLVRVSMLSVAGYAWFATFQGWFAGRSDVRAPLTLAIAGGAVAVVATLALVPRFGLLGGVLGAALFYPAGIAAALLLHRADYGGVLAAPPRPWVDRDQVRALLAVGAGSLALALCDQGALLLARLHYVREHGLAANGHFQAALALSQQTGSAFYTYLAAYAFGTVSGFGDAGAMRAYTRKVWLPITLLAAAGCAAVVLISSPLLRLLYSDEFVPARRLVGWLLLGELARVAMQTWALASLPLGGVRLWLPILLASPVALIASYPAWVAAGAGAVSLPLAYASAGLASLAAAGVAMSRRGVTLGARHVAAIVGSLALLAALALWRARP